MIWYKIASDSLIKRIDFQKPLKCKDFSLTKGIRHWNEDDHNLCEKEGRRESESTHI